MAQCIPVLMYGLFLAISGKNLRGQLAEISGASSHSDPSRSSSVLCLLLTIGWQNSFLDFRY